MTRPAVPPPLPPGWGLRAPVLEVLSLGAGSYEVAHEAVVLGRVLPTEVPGGPEGEDLVGRARSLVAEGAALVEVTLSDDDAVDARVAAVVGPVVAGLDVPVVVAAGGAGPAAAALAAGAAAIVPTAAPSPRLLSVVAATSSALLLPLGAWPGAEAAALTEAARAASAAGVAPDRLLLDVACPSAAGTPILASDPCATDARARSTLARGQRSAAFALAVAGGARLLRTTDPRSARRTSVALAAIRRAAAARHGAPA